MFRPFLHLNLPIFPRLSKCELQKFDKFRAYGDLIAFLNTTLLHSFFHPSRPISLYALNLFIHMLFIAHPISFIPFSFLSLKSSIKLFRESDSYVKTCVALFFCEIQELFSSPHCIALSVKNIDLQLTLRQVVFLCKSV